MLQFIFYGLKGGYAVRNNFLGALGHCQAQELRRTAEKWREEYPAYEALSNRFVADYIKEIQSSPAGRALMQLSEQGCPQTMTQDQCNTLRMSLLEKLSKNQRLRRLMEKNYRSMKNFLERHPAARKDFEDQVGKAYTPK